MTRVRHIAVSRILAAIVPVIVLTACTRVPSGVIPPDRMAELLADMHVGESYIEYNSSTFRNDSAKENLRLSIFRANGVTEAEVDSSFAWYGHHIDTYNDVYNHTVEILKERQLALGNQIASQAAISFSGDSVDIWTGSRHVKITPRSPAQGIRFDLPIDSMLSPGDSYTWRMKLLNTEPNITIRWNTVAEYADGTVETYTTSTHSRTWHEASFVTDSVLTLTSLSATAKVEGPATDFNLDSITLVRRRFNRVFYKLHIHQKRY